MTVGRTVWPAQTRPRGRVCSMAWRSLRMSELIRQMVERTYRSHIGLPTEWSPEQQRLFLDREAARLSHRSAALAAELGEAAITEWARRMGQAPDYLTSVGLRNNATAQAREQVLTEELYALVPQDPDHDLPQTQQQPQTVEWGNPDRWRTPRRSEPTEAIQTLVARLWPDRSDWFAIKAEYLLQARSEDGHELPNSPHSRLARELASLVEADLADDGLPTG